MKTSQKGRGISDLRFGLLLVLVTLAFSAISLGFIGSLSSQANDIRTQQAQIQQLIHTLQSNNGSKGGVSLPVMNQTTTTRTIWFTWYLAPEAHQDRFDPTFSVVNQGDTVQLTLIDNDTVAHDLVIGGPYNIVVNATVPGLVNDLTGEEFTTSAKNNSPGVVVSGTPGNVSATYSFVAKYAGVFEFVCTYHAQVGMIGYLVVLPNAAFTSKPSAGHTSGGEGGVTVDITAGAGTNTTSHGYFPNTITVSASGNNTVTWVNNDNAPHTVTADDGSFNSGNIAPGGSFSFTFTTAGTYRYHCTYHPWMTGTIIVGS